MDEISELRASLGALHGEIEELLTNRDPAVLLRTLVPDRWNVLDVIGHINGWGLLFLGDARYMARHPGKLIPYNLYSTSNYDDENEALVVRRRAWTVAQHQGENRQLIEALLRFIDSFAGRMPAQAVPQPWLSAPMSIGDVLRYHGRHGHDHWREILAALGATQ